MGVLMYVFAPQIIGIMTPVEEIRTLGTSVLRIEAFAEPMFAASIVAYGVFVGAGGTLVPSLMNFFSIWAVRLTLAFWLASDYGAARSMAGHVHRAVFPRNDFSDTSGARQMDGKTIQDKSNLTYFSIEDEIQF